MEIKPTYVTFEQSKWLKKKGFDLLTYAYYNGLNFYTGEYKNHSKTTIGDTEMHKRLIGYISAPEQWQVVEWLHLNHNIWISVDMVEKDSFFYSINKHDWEVKQIIFSDDFETPQEAYSAAFDYVLNNLL